VNSEFSGNKGKGSWRLFKGKSTTQVDRLDSPDAAVKNTAQPQLAVPLVEALFLPDFPVKSSDTDFDVRAYTCSFALPKRLKIISLHDCIFIYHITYSLGVQ